MLKKNLAVALIVRCLLSIANQFDALLAGNLPPALYVKIVFNFIIPFTVASLRALRTR